MEDKPAVLETVDVIAMAMQELVRCLAGIDAEDRSSDDQAPNGDVTDAATGDIENVTVAHPVLNGDGEDGTDASAVSAPGVVSNHDTRVQEDDDNS